MEIKRSKAYKRLISYLDDSVIPHSVAQRLIKAFEELDLPTEYQRRLVVVNLMKPMISQVNKQYSEGLAVDKTMGDHGRKTKVAKDIIAR